MTIKTHQKEENKNRRRNLTKVIFLIIYFFILIIIYFIFVISGINPIIAFLILLFFFIIVLGPLFSGMRKSLYSRMFSKKKKKIKGEYQTQKEIIENESQIKSYTPRKIKSVNLNVKYRKPLVAKCSNCGMIVAGFVKKCPKCGEGIS